MVPAYSCSVLYSIIFQIHSYILYFLQVCIYFYYCIINFLITNSIYMYHLIQNSPACYLNYSSVGHVNTGDVDMHLDENDGLNSLIVKRPKFRELRSPKWRRNFISFINCVKDYIRWHAKYNKKELETCQNG